MESASRKLQDAEYIRKALVRIKRWKGDRNTPVACPLCEAPGLVIIDRSARPYAEWYAVRCAACGLDDVVHVALGPPVGGA